MRSLLYVNGLDIDNSYKENPKNISNIRPNPIQMTKDNLNRQKILHILMYTKKCNKSFHISSEIAPIIHEAR